MMGFERLTPTDGRHNNCCVWLLFFIPQRSPGATQGWILHLSHNSKYVRVRGNIIDAARKQQLRHSASIRFGYCS